MAAVGTPKMHFRALLGLGMATLARRGSSQNSVLFYSLVDSVARALWAALPEIWLGICLGMGSHIPKACIQGFLRKWKLWGGTGKGRGKPSGTWWANPLPLQALCVVSSNRMPGAPQNGDSFVFIWSTITCCWPFSWALLKATGCGFCQERRKEGGRPGKWQELGLSSPPTWPWTLKAFRLSGSSWA